MRELIEWFKNLDPSTQAALRDAGIVLLSLLVGLILAALARWLLGFHAYDRKVLPPGQEPDPERPGLQPVRVVGWIAFASSVMVGTGIIASLRDTPWLVSLARNFIIISWLIVVALTGTLIIGRWFADQLMDFLRQPVLAQKMDSLLPSAPGSQRLSEGTTRIAGALVYVVFVGFGLLLATDLLGLGTAASLLERIAHALVGLIVAGVIFGFGAWLSFVARDKAARTPGAQDTDQAFPTLVLLVAGMLAAAVLVGTGGLVALIVLVVLLMCFRHPLWQHSSDVWAGLYLRSLPARTIEVDGETAELGNIGLLQSEVKQNGKTFRRRNRELVTSLTRERVEGEPVKDPATETPSPQSSEEAGG